LDEHDEEDITKRPSKSVVSTIGMLTLNFMSDFKFGQLKISQI